MKEIYRILDASYNRAREAMRVAEDCGRFALNDPAITALAKNLRSELTETLEGMPVDEMITSRDTPGDIGTEISSPTEIKRNNLQDVATAACKRLTESLRTIEEYGKIVAPQQVINIERMRYNAYTLEQRIMSRIMVGNRLADVKLYVLITSSMCPGSARQTAQAAITGGAEVLQLREKDVCDAEFLALAAEMRELADETGRIFIVNDRPDIASIVGADGLHLGQTDLPIAEARRLLRPGAAIGRSCHNIHQVRAAVTEGADYISIGPMFETTTKDAGPLAGLELLKQATEEVSLPIVPIGGITADNIDQLIEAGAKRVAVCSAICCADSPKDAAAAIKAKLG